MHPSLLGRVLVSWRGQFSILVEALGGAESDDGLDWPRLTLALMHDSHADPDVLGLALHTLVVFLSGASAAARGKFAQSGGFVALESILCSHAMTREQQRACVSCILQVPQKSPTKKPC